MTRSEARPSIPDVLARFQSYHVGHPVWGSLHLVLDDGNVSDADVEYCIAFARDAGDAEGEALARILRSMSRTQRTKLPRMA